MQDQDKPAGLVRAVAGIDAAITARHHIAVREFFDDGTEHLSRFTVDPTLAGLERLSQRLAAVPAPLTAVVEPTSMTWLALALAVERAGGRMEMIGARHSSRLRGAIMGKNKSDVIDSEVLTHVGEIFDPPPLVLASPGQLALLLRAGETLSDRYSDRLSQVFDLDDPTGKLQAAWNVKEQLRALLRTGSLQDASAAKTRLGELVDHAAQPETTRLWRTVCRWWKEIEVLIVTGATTAKLEANNTAIKHLKRTGRGFVNSRNYTTRIMLRSAARTAA